MAAEPMTTLRVSETHEWRLVDWEWRIGDRLTWELHYLHSTPHTTYIRAADRFETQTLNAAKREVDAAHGVGGPRVRGADEPLPPDVLVDARQDRVHEQGEVKPSTRSRARNAGVKGRQIDGDQPLPDLILQLHRDGLAPNEIAATLARLDRDSEADAAGISIRAVIEESADGVAIPRTVRQSSNQRDEKE